MLRKSLVAQGLFPDSMTNLNALISVIEFVGELNFYDTGEFSYLGPSKDNRKIASFLSERSLNAILLTPGYRMKTEDLDPGSPKKKIGTLPQR